MSGTTDSPEHAWTHLTALLDRGGHVTLGRMDPFDGVAVAADAQRVLASLLRREGEVGGGADEAAAPAGDGQQDARCRPHRSRSIGKQGSCSHSLV